MTRGAMQFFFASTFIHVHTPPLCRNSLTILVCMRSAICCLPPRTVQRSSWRAPAVSPHGSVFPIGTAGFPPLCTGPCPRGGEGNTVPAVGGRESYEAARGGCSRGMFIRCISQYREIPVFRRPILYRKTHSSCAQSDGTLAHTFSMYVY